MTFTQGHLLSGRYRLDEVIAGGGMGTVWRGTDELLGRLVAIKVLHGDTAAGVTAGTGAAEDFHARFRAEARSSAALSHPNIATVFDFGEDDAHPYLVMELVEGSSLAQLLAERGALPPDEVASILGQAALALQVAHTAGVVHRDVKPANIMLTAAGLVKLTDFGIARVATASGLTRTGEVLGTPHYLSPEQAQGQPATAASDIYALGVVGHELLTGTRPFHGESMVATALAHVTQPAPELPEAVPAPLRTAVMAALAKDPAARPSSGGAFAAMLGMPVGPVTPPTGLSGVATEVIGTGATGTQVIGTEATGLAGPAPTAILTTAQSSEDRRVSDADVPRTAVGSDRPDPRPARAGGRGRPWWLVPVGAAGIVLAIVVAALSLGGRGDSTPPTTTPTTPVVTKASAPTTSTPTTTTRTTTTSPVPAPKPEPGKGKGKGGKKK
jgi:serine/threonine-protein kinase